MASVDDGASVAYIDQDQGSSVAAKRLGGAAARRPFGRRAVTLAHHGVSAERLAAMLTNLTES